MYEELQRLRVAKQKAEAITDFLEWLGEHGKVIAERHAYMRDYFIEDGISIEARLYDYFEIDPKKLEEERRQVLEEHRKHFGISVEGKVLK